MAKLTRITIFPIKSLEGTECAQSELTTGGALVHDRRFALVDADGRILNAKRDPKLHLISVTFDPACARVTLTRADLPTGTFALRDELPALCQWLARACERDIALVENPTGGFPDDTDAPGPTIVSTATLEAVASWFQLSLDETRRRFRANLEIDGVPPFWEDQLYTAAARVRFQIGKVTLSGHNPCQRCAVPTRDSHTGAVDRAFTKLFNQRRMETLPPWVARERFDHFYRLSVNTSANDQVGKVLSVGDDVTILGPEVT